MMKIFGFILLIIGCIWTAAAFMMDTTVVSDGMAIHNLGLIADRSNQISLGIGLFITGAIFFAIRKNKTSNDNVANQVNTARWLPFIAFLLIGALLAAGVWMSGRENREALPSPLIGKPAPDFTLPVLHEPGRTVSAGDLRGQPYLLNVWGSWCVECQVEHPVLTRFAETKRLRVVGYNWKDEPADALRWLERFGNPYWVVLSDQQGGTAIDFGIYGAPETFLVDAAGIIRWKHVGAVSDATLRDELLPLLDAIERGE